MATPNYRTLPVKLTPDEVRVRATQAAEKQEEYCDVERRKKDLTRDLGQQLKTKRSEIETLLRAVRTGKEDQLVQVTTRRNEDRRTIETLRMDTGEIIDSRAMTVEERQGKLFGIDGGKAKKGKDDAEAKQAQDAKKDAAKKDAEDAAKEAKNGGTDTPDDEAVLEDPAAKKRFDELMDGHSRDSLRALAPKVGVSGRGGKKDIALRIVNAEIARAKVSEKTDGKSAS